MSKLSGLVVASDGGPYFSKVKNGRRYFGDCELFHSLVEDGVSEQTLDLEMNTHIIPEQLLVWLEEVK